jgi:peptidoglycan L-alanyl-D-glutamate endopeptidase CwlK
MSPPFKGSYSAGPMQVLATTARELIATKGKAYQLALDREAVAPALRKRPVPAPRTHPLYDAATSIALGTAAIRRQLALTGDDPILVAAAYNSGGLYRSRSNAWRLRSHGDHLDRAARWYGDACAVLAEMGI